jgi:hypothetical protein
LGSPWNHGNHNTLLIFNTHECQETQIKNPFDPILSFGLITDFWKWKTLPLKKDIFTTNIEKNHIIEINWWQKIWNDNNLLNALKKHEHNFKHVEF